MNIKQIKGKLIVPVKDVRVNQLFGANFYTYDHKKKKSISFYTDLLGIKGHNGIDFHTKKSSKKREGTAVLAAHDGVVTFAGKDGDGGVCVSITEATKGESFRTIYYHLEVPLVKVNDKVKAGDKIAIADNTGTMTTGDHLHFGLKELKDNVTVNQNNGYKGALNPADYFVKNWDKSRAYHRYGREGSYLAEIKVRFKNPYLHRKLKETNNIKLVYDNEFINGLVYGGWDIDTLLTPSMYETWAYLKKDEFEKGVETFL